VDILIEGNRIAAIGVGLPLDGTERVIDGTGKLALPGLINTHHHFYQNITRNVPVMQKGDLLRWLLFSYGIWADLDEEDVYAAARLSAAELLLTGVTTSMDFMYFFPKGRTNLMDAEFKAVGEIGLRFHGFRGCMPVMEGDIPSKIALLGIDPKELVESRDTIMTACSDTFSKFHDSTYGSMTRVGLGPTTVPFDMPDLLNDLNELATKQDGLIHLHLHPRPDERKKCLALHGTTPHRYLEEIGWLSPRVSLAHVTQHTLEDITILAKNGVSITHSPSCHMRLGYPVAPIPECIQAGVNVGLGVDGGSSNDSGDMLAELRAAMYVHRIQGTHENYSQEDWLGPEDVFTLATNNGAKLLARDDIGRIEVGRMADVVLVNMNQIAYASAMADPLGALVYCGFDHRVDTSIVNGKVVVDAGRLTTAREDDIVRESNRVTSKLLDAAHKRTGIDYRCHADQTLNAKLS